MPRFSVVVPLRGVAAYADESFASICGQTFGDFEVIAVDDASDDGCADVVRRWRARDDRVVGLRLPTSRGVGNARNAGVARATGEYLLFLDGDDTFTDADTFAALSGRLDHGAGPDVLLYDYRRVHPCGITKPSNLSRLVTWPDAGPFPLRDHPLALRVSWMCGNKAWRRRFVLDHGLAFPTGAYEDFLFTISGLLAAERVDILPRICLDYRKCRPNSLSGQVGAGQFAVFDQIARIREFLDRHPGYDFAEVRPLLADSFLVVLRDRSDRKKVIPDDLLAEYRRRTEEVREWRDFTEGVRTSQGPGSL